MHELIEKIVVHTSVGGKFGCCYKGKEKSCGLTQLFLICYFFLLDSFRKMSFRIN